MKKIILLALLISVFLALHSQVKVVLWHSYRGDEKEALVQVANNFNNSQTEIVLELLMVPFDAFPDKITAAIPRGKGPDIFIFAHDRIGGWVEAGIIEPLEFYLEDGVEKRFVAGSYEPMFYKNSVYGLPMSLKSIILFYNPNIIKSPPQTTAEMITMAKQHTNPDEGRYGLVYENANYYYHACWMQGFGGRVFDANDKPILNSEESIASFQFAQDLYLKENIIPPEVSNVLVTTLYNEQKAAMVISGPWFRGEIDKDVPYEIELLPVISPVNNRAMPFMSSEGIIMSAKSVHKDEAFKVMEYLISDDAAFIMATIGKQPVANISVYDRKEVAEDKYIPKFKEQIGYSIPMPSIPQMTFVWSPASTAITAVINGKDPREELDKAQATVLENLKAAGF
ncbi:MAG: extracellular solute-binding protein [Candidatus Cloacimonetes bacterium]|nr:extracellular solute-binding protein [Candidatus Cloacimonadota bacterium]